MKCPDTLVDLVWANTYISGHVMHNSVGTVVRIYPHTKVIHLVKNLHTYTI